MLKPTKHKVERYEYEDFYVEIADVGDYWEAWLCRKDMGTFWYLFSLLKGMKPFNNPDGEPLTYEGFLEIVEESLPDYIEEYNEDHPKEA